MTFKPSKASAASVDEQIFNSALLSDTLAYHPLDAIGGRGSAIGSATPDLWSVGHGPGLAGHELGIRLFVLGAGARGAPTQGWTPGRPTGAATW